MVLSLIGCAAARNCGRAARSSGAGAGAAGPDRGRTDQSRQEGLHPGHGSLSETLPIRLQYSDTGALAMRLR